MASAASTGSRRVDVAAVTATRIYAVAAWLLVLIYTPIALAVAATTGVVACK